MQEDSNDNKDPENKFVLESEPPKNDDTNVGTPNTISDFIKLETVPDVPVIDVPVVVQNEPKVVAQESSEASITVPNEVAQTPVTDVFTAPVAPKKKSKKLIVLGIVLVLIAALLGGSVYAFNTIYQSPQKVLTDAIVQAVSAKKSMYVGDIKITNDEFNISASLSVKQDGASSGSLNLSLSVVYDDKTYTMTTDALVDGQGDYFFKVSDIKDIVKEFKAQVGLPADSMLALAIDNLVNKIDGSWIKISKSDIEKYGNVKTTEQTCIEGVVNSMYSDATIMKEFTDVYVAHPFISIKSELASQNGSLGYEIEGDAAKFKAFLLAVNNTDVYKSIIACDSQYSIKEEDLDFDSDSSADSSSDVTLKVWADYWTHQLTKIELTGSSDGTNVSITMTPDYNPSISVSTPSEFLEPSDLEDYVESVWNAFSYEYMATSYMSDDTTSTMPYDYSDVLAL